MRICDGREDLQWFGQAERDARLATLQTQVDRDTGLRPVRDAHSFERSNFETIDRRLHGPEARVTRGLLALEIIANEIAIRVGNISVVDLVGGALLSARPVLGRPRWRWGGVGRIGCEAGCAIASVSVVGGFSAAGCVLAGGVGAGVTVAGEI